MSGKIENVGIGTIPDAKERETSRDRKDTKHHILQRGQEKQVSDLFDLPLQGHMWRQPLDGLVEERVGSEDIESVIAKQPGILSNGLQVKEAKTVG